MTEDHKTWLESEIIQLMAEELKAYRHDCTVRQRNWSYDEMAENLYSLMSDKGLIEHTP